MLKLIIAAIIWLQPYIPAKTARSYADTIVLASVKYQVDPFLVVAQIQRETGGTWNKRLKSKTHDHGLMQIHVTADSSPMYLGREELLYDPHTNIRRGIYLLSFFRQWHKDHCGTHSDHPYWTHYKFGLRRPPKDYVDMVREVYAWLLLRAFGSVGEV